MLVILPELQQLPKHLQSLWLQSTRIHQLLIVLPPAAHVVIFGSEFGGLEAVGLEEVDGFLPFDEPEFVLNHKRNCRRVSGIRHTLYCYNCRYPDTDAAQRLLNFFHKVSHGYY